VSTSTTKNPCPALSKMFESRSNCEGVNTGFRGKRNIQRNNYTQSSRKTQQEEKAAKSSKIEKVIEIDTV
jgi:hypothetical protein